MDGSNITCHNILEELKNHANPESVAGMARFGIRPGNVLGVSIPTLRSLARQIGTNHRLAAELWSSGVHEARILACMIDDPEDVTEAQLEYWVRDFDSWDVCDQCCNKLFDRTPWAWKKAEEWSAREEEFVKRAGFVLMTQLAVHDKAAPDERFERFFPIIIREAADERNYVKKAVNWALRQIGKRNRALNGRAVEIARSMLRIESKAARWIAGDALRELTDLKVRGRLKK